jgi:hypothetical protein
MTDLPTPPPLQATSSNLRAAVSENVAQAARLLRSICAPDNYWPVEGVSPPMLQKKTPRR